MLMPQKNTANLCGINGILFLQDNTSIIEESSLI
jgi:hypothetical protein